MVVTGTENCYEADIMMVEEKIARGILMQKLKDVSKDDGQLIGHLLLVGRARFDV